MNNDRTVSFVQACVVAVVAAVVTGILVLTFAKPNTTVVNQQAAGTSPAGSTFSTAKTAYVAVAWSTATSTSVFNSDSNSRFVKSFDVACTGVGTSNTQNVGAGLASWRISAATSTMQASSSAAASFATLNGNFAVTNVLLSTTSPWLLISSTTAQANVGGFASTTEWLSNTYMNIFVNATNTAACTLGFTYIPG